MKLAVEKMLDREYAKRDRKSRQEGKKEGIKEGKEKGRKEEALYNIPINVDTIKEGYPILCA